MNLQTRAGIAAAALLLIAAGCGGRTASVPMAQRPSSAAHGGGLATGRTTAATTTTVAAPKPKPKPPVPHVLAVAGLTAATPFVPAVTLGGRPIVYVARSRAGIALLSFDQRYLGLHLHSGTADAGPTGWRYGSRIAGRELRAVVAGFNGGFRLATGSGGFFAYGRTAVPLRPGLASVVTYADGFTDIGTWHGEVPSGGHGSVVSVRQNLDLFIDHGHAASSVGCDSCWGATLGGVAATARSAIGVTADGNLVWAGGLNLRVADLASAMRSAHVVRAAEMDINPEWVAVYLYQHRASGRRPTPVPASPGQRGIYGQLLLPYSRDFFTVALRPHVR